MPLRIISDFFSENIFVKFRCCLSYVSIFVKFRLVVLNKSTFEVCPNLIGSSHVHGNFDWCMAGSVNTENGTLKFVETLHSLGGAVFDIYPHPEGPITREKLCSEYIKYNIHIYYIQNNYFHYIIIFFSTFTAPKQLVRNAKYCPQK